MRDDCEDVPTFYCNTMKQFSSCASALRQCAELYCKIWKEPPWCEDFWKAPEVLQMMEKEMQRPDAECFLAVKTKQLIVIGFTWGYSVDRQELAEISGGNRLDFITENTPRVFYIDELGVDPASRLNRVGNTLTRELIGHAKERGHRRIVVRTDLRAIPARILYGRHGFIELNVKDERHENRNYWLLNL